MEAVTITGITIENGAKPSKSGTRIIAFFNCDVGVFSLTGCALVRTAKGGLGIRLPKLDDAFGSLRSVKLNCETTRNAILQRARDAYRMMGGTEAEWCPRESGDGRSSLVQVAVHKRRIEPDEGEDRAGLETFLGSEESAQAQADGGK